MHLTERLPYYPRPELLGTVLRLLLAGAHVTLFSPRRKGKTHFVKNELLPAAVEQGWFVGLVDLWRDRQNAAEALVVGLEALAASKRQGDKLTAPLKLSKVKASLKTGGVVLSGDWEMDGLRAADARTSLEDRLAVALHGVASKGSHALIALDEFQSLAGPGNANFIAAFRTALQGLEGSISIIYTGSSHAKLNAMFRMAEAALFQSAHPVKLPQLDRGFVESRARYLSDFAGMQVDVDELERLFVALDHTPLFLNEIVLHMVASQSPDIPEAVRWWIHDKRENNYDALLDGLHPVDTSLVMQLSFPGVRSVYESATRDWIAEFLSDTDIKPDSSVLQASVRRLVRKEFIEPTGARGEYEIVDKAFTIFLRQLNGLDLLETMRPRRALTKMAHGQFVLLTGAGS